MLPQPPSPPVRPPKSPKVKDTCANDVQAVGFTDMVALLNSDSLSGADADGTERKSSLVPRAPALPPPGHLAPPG